MAAVLFQAILLRSHIIVNGLRGDGSRSIFDSSPNDHSNKFSLPAKYGELLAVIKTTRHFIFLLSYCNNLLSISYGFFFVFCFLRIFLHLCMRECFTIHQFTALMSFHVKPLFLLLAVYCFQAVSA